MEKTAEIIDVLTDINSALEQGTITKEEHELFSDKYTSLNEDEVRKVYGRKVLRGESFTALINSHFQYRLRLRFYDVDPMDAAEDVLNKIENKLGVLPINEKIKLPLGGGTSAVVKKVDDRTVELVSVYY